ncbi:MAG: hypothetical protein KatS3mg102_1826 [Planctomycetota bacterium]|nr:MAG: hypothetical protein KatS3mg102_1826 [Planctomycetota bacterium]
MSATDRAPPLEAALQLLLAEQALGAEELRTARRRAAARGVPLEEELLAAGLLTEEQICDALARALGTAHVFPHPDHIDRELLACFPPELLLRLEAVPMLRDEEGVTVAFAEPPAPEQLAALAEASGGPVRAVLATRRKIRRALERLLPAAFEPAAGGAPPAAGAAAPSRPAALGSSSDPAAVALLYGTLARAVEAGASEVRFEPDGAVLRVRRRSAEGYLEAAGEAGIGLLGALLERLRLLAGQGPYGTELRGCARVRTELGGQPAELEIGLLRGTAGGPAVRIGLRRLEGADAVTPERLGAAGSPAAALLGALAGRRAALLLAASPRLEVARAFAIALGQACAPERYAVLALDAPGPPADPRFLALAPASREARLQALHEALAYAPDVLLALDGEGAGQPAPGGGPAPQAAALLALAARCLVIVASAEPSAAAAVLGWLEAGARPSLLGAALERAVWLEPEPPWRPHVLAPDARARAALAAGERARFLQAIGALPGHP